MARVHLAEILIHRQRVVDRARRELSVKTDFRIDVGVKVESQPVTHARVLLMRERCEARRRRVVRAAKDPVEAQTKITAKTKRPDRKNLAFEFLDAIFDWLGLCLSYVDKRSSRCSSNISNAVA